MTSSELLEKYTCEIVEDLLPFYAEHKMTQSGSIPKNSRDNFISGTENFAELPAFAFVEEHVKCCANCESLLEMIQEDCQEPTPARPGSAPIHFRRKYHIRLAFGIVGATLTAAGVLVLLL